jgi:putative tricarboxylic transport membrane protein
MHRPAPVLQQTLIGAGVLAIAGVLAFGALSISSEAGYSGVGPNFLPWFVAAVLLVCGLWMVWESRTGGFRDMEEPSGAERGDWHGFAWVSAGLLANAFLIGKLGFVLSCTVCFVLASIARIGTDALVGFAIAAPVYWMFTKLLGINLPGLTGTGWI